MLLMSLSLVTAEATHQTRTEEMDFKEALSKYVSNEPTLIYKNRTPFRVVVTIEAMQTKTAENFAFGKAGPEIVCQFFQLCSASFLASPNDEISGYPSIGAEVWINVSTQAIDPTWVVG